MKLTACMKVVSAMSDLDRDALLDRLEGYIEDGVPTQRAQIMAASDTLAELEDERREFMRLLKAQHPEIFVVTAPEVRQSADRNNPVGRDAALSRLYSKAAEVYDEAFEPDEAYDALYEAATPPEQFILRQLKKDDFLGFDYPHQALREVQLSMRDDEYAGDFDISPALKAAVSRLGNTFGTSRFSADRTPLGFYSALARGIDSVPINSAPAGAWRAAIKGLLNKGAAKADELEWSGLNDWLDLQDGKISKERVTEYLKQGGVQVEETVLGERSASTHREFGNVLDAQDFIAEFHDQTRAEMIEDYGFANPRDYIDAANQMFNDQFPDSRDNVAKYGQYTLPGGENYREVLLTLPQAQGEKIGYRQREDGSWELFDSDGPFKTVRTEAEARERASEAQRDAARKSNDGKTYRSSHWDQPNVIAHIRLNDRTDADGNKVLFVEELQSDWGQEGKKKGFSDGDSTPPDTSGWRAEKDYPTTYDGVDGFIWRVLKADGSRASNGIFGTTEAEAIESLARTWARRNKADAIPKAPFVTKTDGWLNLALKRVMVMAAEGGYDKVAFVNGEQSADRYDLSTQIKYVQWNTGYSGGRLITLEDQGGTEIGISAEPDGTVYDSSIDGAEGKKLDEVLGKELADKIMASDQGDLRGLELKVGGEGMKAFYDAIVPSALKKLLPKVGGEKLAAVTIGSNRLEVLDDPKAQGFILYDRQTGTYYRGGASGNPWSDDPYRAKVYLSESTANKAIPEIEGGSVGLEQPGFDVTDAMREKVAGGLPLFSRDRQTDTPEFKAWFGNSKVVDEGGNPLMVYHGTEAKFSAFDGPAFFTDNPDEATEYGGAVIAAYVRISRPKRLDSFDQMEAMQNDEIERYAALGYDGFIGEGAGGTHYVAFRPEQIKSATGNVGAYSQRPVTAAEAAALGLTEEEAQVAQAEGDIRFSADRDYKPKKTVKAYKLFRTDARQPGKLFPLFVMADQAVPMGEWLRAEIGPMTGDKVKSKLGPLAFRPGWHAGDTPVATHIGMKDGVADKKPKYRNPEHVWAEVEFAADVDWQAEANQRGTNASGKLVPVRAAITDQLPSGGFYRYKTNPNMEGTWLIGGEMKVSRVLSDSEVKRINDKAGTADLPRKEPLDLKAKGFPAGRPTVRKSEDRVTDTPEFKRWFGDSKVVDEDGRPLVVYTGTSKDVDFTKFKVPKNGAWFTGDKYTASAYALENDSKGLKYEPDTRRYAEVNSASRVMPVYLRIENPYTPTSDEMTAMIRAANYKREQGKLFERVQAEGYDGVDMGNDTWVVLGEPTQIKSAIGNGGAFDLANPDITKSADRPWFDDLRKLKISTNYQLGDLLKSSKKLSWWDRSVGTQYGLAQRHPQFKRVFDAVQLFINDVSTYATRAADLAPSILPKLETLKDILRSPLSAEDVKALREPIFGGTLKYTRDDEGNIVDAEDVSTAGVVFTNDELRDRFGLDDRQVKLYREFRRATNRSLTDLAVSDMLRYLGSDGEGVRQRALEATSLDGALNAMVAHLDMLIEQQPKRAAVLEDTKRAIKEKAGQAIGLMARGYAPLSRFGQYTVYAVGADGEQLYFSMFENERDANKMAREMRDQYPEATVTTGTMSQESYKLFSGVTPETLALFGESLGLEESGVDAKSEVFQAYLKMAKTNRSAMKRLIQRKGIDGFSEDAGRVLAGFVYSNARQISTNLHAGEISRSAAAVTDGDVKDAAVRLMEYVQNPMEEAQAIRGLLFTQFIGGSIASAMVNMTQPFTMTLPYLSQFDGTTGAAKRMADAVKLTARGVRNDEDLQKALKRAELAGVVSPQEVHQLMAQAQGKSALQAGDGTKVGDAAAKVNNAMAKLGLVWGKLFSAAEQFNRRVTFIAAYKMARDQGMADPFAFAENAIAETQGVYNKGNKPKWARGAVGGTLFTFKQYSISYMEFLVRMWGNGPEGKKAVGLALAVLFMTAGLSGLPGADDLDDVIDGFLQRVLGKSFDSKQAKKEFFASLIGQPGAEFVMSGLSGLPGVPIDVSGRMGLGNLIPGTGIFTKKRDYGRDYLEVAGPAGTLFTNMGSAVANVAQGELKKAAEVMAPVAAANVVKAVDMAQMGYYRDLKGRKVIDTDALDAAFKAIGFQPRAVAQVQEATAAQANLIGQNKLRETEIADKMARGRIERKPELTQEAQQEVVDWNRRNPDSKIQIDQAQINKRVQEANKTKAQRVAATAPKEIRASVKKELERDTN